MSSCFLPTRPSEEGGDPPPRLRRERAQRGGLWASAPPRAPRPGEGEGPNYLSLSAGGFARRVDAFLNGAEPDVPSAQ